MGRLSRLSSVSAVTATVTLLLLQPVSFGRGAPTLFLVVAGGWLFVRGLFLTGAALFAAADGDEQPAWRLLLVPLQIVLGFGALYAAIWRLEPGALVGAGLEPPLRRFSGFAATLGGAGGISPEEPAAQLALLAEVIVLAIAAGALVRRWRKPVGWVAGASALVLAGGLALWTGEDPRLRDGFERGVTLTGFHRDAYAGREAADAVRAARDLGASSVTIVPTWYQGKRHYHGVGPDEQRTPTDESVEQIIRHARDLGLEVTLKPHVDVLDGSYRGEIVPDDLDAWFESYTGMLARYSDLAERAGASQFVVGTELERLSVHTERWRKLVDGVRARFNGRLTYAANWTEVAKIRFWDALDRIGVDAYYPLSNDGEERSVSDLIQAWSDFEPPRERRRDYVSELERLHGRYDKPLLLTEIGYPSAASAARTPYEVGGKPDPELQRRLVEAALAVWAEPDWVAGISWWHWTSEPSKLVERDRSHALNGKPAAARIREWYSD